MDDHIITLDSPEARAFGFTSDLYDGWLWKHDDRVIISFIACQHPGRGDFSRLLDRIWQAGHEVAVPTPLGKMLAILTHKGFRQTFEWSDDYQEDVELWLRGPDRAMERR